MKTALIIPKTKRAILSTGAGGTYIKITEKIGVKIPGTDPFYGSLADEVKSLQLVNKRCPGIFPAFYGVIRVKYKGRFRKAMLIEHIPGDTFDQLNLDENDDDQRADRLYKKLYKLFRRLKKAKIKWTDQYEGSNYMRTPNGRVRLIDTGNYYSIHRNRY